MIGQVEVVLYHRSDDEQAVVTAYHEASKRMAGTPGLLGNQLLRAVGDQQAFTVVSRWADWAAFTAWEGSSGHKDQTAPLRPYRDFGRERPFEVYQVAASYGSAGG